MASKTPPIGADAKSYYSEAFDSEALDIFQQAFDAAWLELQHSHFTAEEASDVELRTLLSEKIMALASAGELDRNELVNRALKSFRSL